MRTYARLCAILAVCTVATLPARAADSKGPVAPKLSFAVPESPAFSLLGNEPGTLLRPTSARDLALELSDLVDDSGGVTLPADLGLEFSPAMLLRGPRLTLDQYRANPALYRMRLSLASQRDPDAGTTTKLAAGLRITVIDDADFRSSAAAGELRAAIAADLEPFFRDEQAIRNEIYGTRRFTDDELGPDLIASFRLRLLGFDDEFLRFDNPDLPEDFRESWTDAEVIEFLRKLEWEEGDDIDHLVPETLAAREAQINAMIEQKFEAFREEHWNARSLEFAFGASGSAADSTGADFQLRQLSAWATYSHPVGSTGQLLWGTNAGASKGDGSEELHSFGDVRTRLYIGATDQKLLVEASGTFEDGERPVWMFQSGAELKLPADSFLELKSGLRYDEDSGKAELVSTASVRIGALERALPFASPPDADSGNEE